MSATLEKGYLDQRKPFLADNSRVTSRLPLGELTGVGKNSEQNKILFREIRG